MAAGDGIVPDRDGWREELNELDVAVYSVIAATPTPALDHAFRRLSRWADHWKLWLASAAALAIAGGARGRRAALSGLASMSISSAVVYLGLKPVAMRRRPDRLRHDVPVARHVSMPRSPSFPSGHAAAAAAFATGVATAIPEAGVFLGAAAALVGYSRVHTGVHYPLDVMAGSVSGTAVAQLVVAALAHRTAAARGSGRDRRERTGPGPRVLVTSSAACREPDR